MSPSGGRTRSVLSGNCADRSMEWSRTSRPSGAPTAGRPQTAGQCTAGPQSHRLKPGERTPNPSTHAPPRPFLPQTPRQYWTLAFLLFQNGSRRTPPVVQRTIYLTKVTSRARFAAQQAGKGYRDLVAPGVLATYKNPRMFAGSSVAQPSLLRGTITSLLESRT